MSKKVQYQRKEVLSQSSDSEDPLQLRRSLDSEDEDSVPASNQQKGNASKNSQLSKNSNDAADTLSRAKRTRSRRRRSQKGSQQAVVANTQAQVKTEQQPTVKAADQQKRKASDSSKSAKETLNTQPARDASTVAHNRRSSRDKAEPKARSQSRGHRNDKPVKFVPKQQKPVDVDVPKPVSVTETKTSQLEALHSGQAGVRQAPDERTAPQSPSSEQQLSPVFVTPVSPNQYVEQQTLPVHPMYMPPAASYAYVPPGYYYPFMPQPMPYYYYPPTEYYPVQAQHGAYVDARGQVYYDLEPQLLQQQIRQQLFSHPTQVDDKENAENYIEQPVTHSEQKFVEVIKIHEAPKPEQPIEAAPAAAAETTEGTQPLSTERVRTKSNTALKPRNAPKTKKAPVWVPKSTVKTTVTPANVS